MADNTDPKTPPVTPPETPPNASEPGASQPGTTPDPELPTEPGVRPTPTASEPGDDGDFDPLDPAKTKAFITKTVANATAPTAEAVIKREIQSEIDSEIEKNPEYKPYADKIRNWVMHPNRYNLIKNNGLPVSAAIAEIMAPVQQRIGAEKARKADEEARNKTTPGSQQRPVGAGGVPDFKGMSAEEIQKTNELVKSGRYQG